MRDENMIAALKRERAGYVARGLDDRVAEVDEQLEHYGHKPTKDAATDDEGAPKGRTSPESAKQTAATPETPKPSTGAKPTPQTAAQKRAGGKD